MTLDSAELAKLAADPGVVAIEPDRTPRLLDERQGLLLADGDLGPTPGTGYLAAYDSLLFGPSETPSTLPFIVDVTDSAIGDGTTTPTSDDMRVDGLVDAARAGSPTSTSSARRPTTRRPARAATATAR